MNRLQIHYIHFGESKTNTPTQRLAEACEAAGVSVARVISPHRDFDTSRRRAHVAFLLASQGLSQGKIASMMGKAQQSVLKAIRAHEKRIAA